MTIIQPFTGGPMKNVRPPVIPSVHEHGVGRSKPSAASTVPGSVARTAIQSGGREVDADSNMGASPCVA